MTVRVTDAVEKVEVITSHAAAGELERRRDDVDGRGKPGAGASVSLVAGAMA